MTKSKFTKTACLSLPFLLTACADKSPTALQQVKNKGEIVIATRYSPTTYYIGPNGETGFEYDLAQRFADYLGVKLKIVTGANAAEVLDMVKRGEANLAAAGIPVTDGYLRQVRYGPAYQQVTPQLVYRLGSTPPADLDGLQHVRLDVAAGSIPAEILRRLGQSLPGLTWQNHAGLVSGELLEKVWKGEYEFTVANSNEVAFLQQFYPELRVAFDLTDPKPLAWVFPRRNDNSLYFKVYDFFRHIKGNGVLRQITERYYGHLQDFDYVGTRRFMHHIKARLPRYIDEFRTAGRLTGLDWRLLAAIAYQESHWNARAVSPTGVRGIMMLTLDTAQQVQIDNRNDPKQSIIGGARYLKMLKDGLPPRILEPDRTWLALAAYNVGLGHLNDARVLTRTRGGNPNTWMDVKKNLPLLRKKTWYSQTHCGYARGDEAVDYVENIRLYYDQLVWVANYATSPPKVTLTASRADSPQVLSGEPAF